MKQRTVDVSINLLPEDPFFDTILGRTMRWAVTVGRYLVIFTEVVVILSFLARFTLDRQLTDLNSSINQKENIVRSFGNLETEVTTAQEKINQYQQLEQSKDLTTVFPALSSITPEGITLQSLSISPTQVSIIGTASSQNALNLLINNIQLSPEFYNVRVERIESQDEQQDDLLFQIQADLEPTPGAVTTPDAAVPVPASEPVIQTAVPGVGI